MAGRPTKLTAEVQEAIVAYIRAGAFDWVAAEAAGIAKATFYRWLKLGEEDESSTYGEFRADVRQARAQARIAAEIEVRRDNPFAWLRYGPGRARPDEPGWTEGHEINGRVELSGDPRLEVLSDEQLGRLIELAERGEAGVGDAEQPASG